MPVLFCMPRARFGARAAAQKCRAQLAHGPVVCVCVCGWAARRQPPQTALVRTGCGACSQFHVNSHAGIFAFALLIWCLRRCGAQGAGMPASHCLNTHTRLAHIKCQDTHTRGGGMQVLCSLAHSLRPANFGRIKVSLLGLRCERERAR